MPFEALGLDPKIAKAVREAGYTEPTPIQTKAIPLVLRGPDVIGSAQTGTGKTAPFGRPIRAERRRSWACELGGAWWQATMLPATSCAG